MPKVPVRLSPTRPGTRRVSRGSVSHPSDPPKPSLSSLIAPHKVKAPF